MKILTIIAAMLVLLVGGLWLYGALQPISYTKSASKDLTLTPLETWERLNDFQAVAGWHPDIDSIVHGNSIEGLNAEYIYYFISGDSLRLHTIDCEPYSRFMTTTSDTTLPFTGTWTYELQEIPGGTHLTVTEHAEIRGAFVRALYNLAQPDTSTVEKFLAYFAE